jgi:hypothetical protein
VPIMTAYQTTRTMISINTIGSDAINRMTVDPLQGDVRVRFHGGTKFYRFENVSRRQILSLILWQDRSLGQWVNRHCLQRHQTVSV